MLKQIFLSGLLALTVTPAFSQATIAKVDFAAVPKGSKCDATAPRAKSIKVRVKRKETQIVIRGDATDAMFFCVLPDGKRLEAILPKVPADATAANLQINADRSGTLFIDSSAGIQIIKVGKSARLSN